VVFGGRRTPPASFPNLVEIPGAPLKNRHNELAAAVCGSALPAGATRLGCLEELFEMFYPLVDLRADDVLRDPNLFPIPFTRDVGALRARARDGDPSARYELGARLYNGFCLEADEDEALVWLRALADSRQPAGLGQLGAAYERGLLGLGQDVLEAARLYESAGVGSSAAMVRLAGLLRRETPPGPDPARAFELLELARKRGSALASAELGDWVARGGPCLRADYNLGLELLREAAGRQSPSGKFYLENVPPPPPAPPAGDDEASSEARYRWARTLLPGSDFIEGTGLPPVLAAEGNPDAAKDLSDLNFTDAWGLITPQAVVALREKHKNKLYPHYLYRSALCRLSGVGLPKDEARGEAELRDAAKTGLLEAMCSLGELLCQRPRRRERREGLDWLEKSHREGFPPAAGLLALYRQKFQYLAPVKKPGKKPR
jgi:TPR repeat protein